MAWITLSSASVKNRLSGAEYSGVTTAALASGQTAEGVVSDQISGVVKLIRGRVAACAHNKLGEGDTIPDELEDAALAMIVYRILTRLPSLKALLDDSRKEANRSAEDLLKDVAACTLVIEQPAIVSDQVIAGAQIQQVSATSRKFTRSSMSGL